MSSSTPRVLQYWRTVWVWKYLEEVKFLLLRFRRKSSAFPSSVHSGNFYGTKLEIPHDVIQEEEEEEDGTTGDIQNSENAAEIEK